MAEPRRLVAVVVTYNRLEMLRKTVMRLLDSPPDELARLVVVDNASTDGTKSWLATLSDPRLDVQRLPRNTGGAGGFEAGMRHAVATYDPDWTLLMDDDARPEPGALAAFHASDTKGWDAVAAAVYFPGGAICDMNRPTLNPFWDRRVMWRTFIGVLSGGMLGQPRDAFHMCAADYADATPKPVDSGSFVGLFVSRRGIERVGFPDGALFIYGDDVLYSLDLRATGGRIGFFPAIRFEHDFSTVAEGERRFRPLWKSYYHHRNLLIVYRRAAGWMFWPVLLVILPKWLLKVRHHKTERRAFLRLTRRAISDGLARRTSVAHETVREWSRET